MVVFAEKNSLNPGVFYNLFAHEVCLETMVSLGKKCGKEGSLSIIDLSKLYLAKGVSFIANRVSLVGIGSSKKHAVLSVYNFSQYFTVHFVSSKICLPCVSPSILWR